MNIFHWGIEIVLFIIVFYHSIILCSDEDYSFTFGGPLNEECSDIVITSDDMYVVLGRTKSWGEVDFDIFVTKFDTFGQIKWTNSFGSSEEDFSYRITELNDGSFALLSRTDGYPTLVKISSENGVIIWQKKYPDDKVKMKSLFEESSTKNIFLAGEYNVYHNGGCGYWEYEWLVIKYSSNGSIVDNNSYYTFCRSGRIHDVAETTGGFYVIGDGDYFEDSDDYRDPLIAKLPFSLGSPLSTHGLGDGSDYDIATCGIDLPSDPNYHIAIAGYDESTFCSTFYLVNEDTHISAGKKICGGPGGEEFVINDLTQTSNYLDFVLVGEVTISGTTTGLIVKIEKDACVCDQTVRVSWVRHVPEVVSFSSVKTHGQQVVMVGTTKDGDCTFLKLDFTSSDNSDTVCGMVNITLSDLVISDTNATVRNEGFNNSEYTFSLNEDASYSEVADPVVSKNVICSTCDGYLNSNTENVCSGHGNCTSPDKCVCEEHYSSKFCDYFECDGVSHNETDVCSGNGVCISPNNCSCEENYYQLGSGYQCANWNCWNVSFYNIEEVCGSHGSCLRPDLCFCLAGYYSLIIGGSCTGYYCGNLEHDSELACSGRGICVSSHVCECHDDFEGEFCETWSCNHFDYKLDQTCSGSGKCESPGVCKCDVGSGGEFCDVNLLYYTVMIPILSVFGVVVFFISLCVLCVFCSILSFCCCTLLVGVVGLGVLGSTVYLQKSRIQKFGKLKNIDILIKEQELEEQGTQARLSFNKKLFEVKYEDIDTRRILGEGGSNSIVFLSKYKGMDVAFKCFKTRTLMSKQDKFDEFEREVELMSSLAHPHIIRFLGACLNPPRVGILMEFCSGGELLEFIVNFREKNMEITYPIDEKIRLLAEVASALVFLHSKKIIHRDIKCENVLVSEEESAKLMDFGLSRLVERMSVVKTKRIGTSIYMAPEIVRDDLGYTEKCDVFSYAIMAFVILTENDNPYPESFQVELKVANDSNFRPDIAEVSGKISEEYDWVCDLIEKCWDEDPEARLSCSEIHGLLTDEKTRESDDAKGNNNIIRKSSTKSIRFVERKKIFTQEDMNKLLEEIRDLKEGKESADEELMKLREMIDALKEENESLTQKSPTDESSEDDSTDESSEDDSEDGVGK